jgi:hypothetical protein
MSGQGFTPARVLWIIASGLLALLGLLAASHAADTGFSLFGWGLLAFGSAFGFWMLERGLRVFDAAQRDLTE